MTRSSALVPLALVALAACGSGDEVFIDAAPIDATVVDAASCAGLDLRSCRNTAGCVPDLCPACGCDQDYRGCLAAGTTPAACPELGCPSAECCRVGADCQAGSCVDPDEHVCGGACNPQENECTADRDCQTAGQLFICDPVPCACNAGARACQPGCLMDEDCATGQTCKPPTGRCEPSECSTADPVLPCPPDFACVGSKCERRTCTDDQVCDGFCVEGMCRSELGTCQLPPP